MTEFQDACEHIKPLIPAVRSNSRLASALLQLDTRFESIMLMPRRSGKSTLTEAYALNDQWLIEDKQSDGELVRQIIGMLKIRRTMRGQFPNYRPRILLRPETWWRLNGNFHWLTPEHIAHLEYPKQAFYSALGAAGVAPDAMAHFGPKWLETFCDAAGRLYPGLALDALEHTVTVSETILAVPTAKAMGAAKACAEFVRTQADIAPFLLQLVPGDKVSLTTSKFSVPYDRAMLRIRQLRRLGLTQLPYKLTGPQYLEYGQYAGIWSFSAVKYLKLATPYVIGASSLKASLTDDAVSRMLRA